MGKTSCGLVVGLALAIGGCSSTKGTRHVSHVSGPYAQPASYQYADSGYPPIAYDRDYYGDGTMVRQTSATYELGSDSADQRISTRPVSMPGPMIRYDISLGEFRRHVNDQTAVIVDARESSGFNRGHVRGAVNIPAGSESEYVDRLHGVGFDELIIVYCGGPDCPAGENVAAYLASKGYTNVKVFKPGWQQLSQTDLTQ